jgi:hypothetical protein
MQQMPESEPMVELIGNAFELSRLEIWSLSSNFSFYAIKKESIEKEGEKYYLKSPRLTARRNEAARGIWDEVEVRSANEITRIAAAIQEEAKILIATIKAAAKIRNLNLDTVEVGLEVRLQEGTTARLGARWYSFVFEELFFRYGWFWKENDIIHFMGAKSGETMEVEIGPGPLQISQEEASTIQKLKRHQLPWPQLDSALNMLEERIFDPHSDEGKTFFHFGGEPSWNNLYNTFEMIKFDVDGILDEKYGEEVCMITKERWAMPDELDKFRMTANNPNAEGRPRHSSAYYNNDKTRRLNEAIKQGKEAVFRYNAERREEKRMNSPPQLMSLSEADRLITRVFRNWCSYKAKKYLKERLLFGASVARLIAHQANLFQKE